MSGPKVDVAKVRRQEKERLVLARQYRQTVAGRIQQYINQINADQKDNAASLIKDENIRLSCVKIKQAQDEFTKELRKLYDIVRDGNELLDVNRIQTESDLILCKFNERVRGELKLIEKYKMENHQLQQLEKNRLMMEASGKKNIVRISADTMEDHIMNDDVSEQVELLDCDINEMMSQKEITSRHKNSILLIRQDMLEIIKSDISLERKHKQVQRLLEEYEKLKAMIKSEIEDMKAVYEEYCKECYDLPGTYKLFQEFTTIEEMKDAIMEAKNKAESLISKEYIKRQIDEVMMQHGYDVVRSDLLEETTQNGQILYGVDQETAIHVFVSNENQVTMRVVGIGFDSEVSDEEEDKLYQQQCAFCSLHPQITAELEMRGVILHTKKHMPPDRKFNKKIQTRLMNEEHTISRGKRETKRMDHKMMYKE